MAVQRRAPAVTNVLRGAVEQHSGLERPQPGVDGLLLRVVLRRGDDLVEAHFSGLWAAVLHTLEPGDCLAIENVKSPEQASEEMVWKVLPRSAAVVVVFRSGRRARLNWNNLDAEHIPKWLRLPPSKDDAGDFQYVRYLCTLRDSVVVNLWAVVWEHARPGTAIYKHECRTNIVVVDKSLDCLRCSEWACADDVPQYCVRMAVDSRDVHGFSPEDLPFLCMGDVLRVHQARIWCKPDRFVNIQQQRGSSLIVCKSSDSGCQEDTAELQFAAIGRGADAITSSDRERAFDLQRWAYSRLSQSTVSSYLVLAAELRQSDAHRDLVVQVLGACIEERVLFVSDGSLPGQLRVRADEPARAASWLFRHVRAGHWLKLRNVEPDSSWCGESDAASRSERSCIALQVSAATVTRMPIWCFDVVQRASNVRNCRFDNGSPRDSDADAATTCILPSDTSSATAGTGATDASVAVAPAIVGVQPAAALATVLADAPPDTAEEASGSGSTTVVEAVSNEVAAAAAPLLSRATSTAAGACQQATASVTDAGAAIADALAEAPVKPPACGGRTTARSAPVESVASSASKSDSPMRRLIEHRSPPTATSADTELDADEEKIDGDSSLRAERCQQQPRVRLTTVHHDNGEKASRLSDIQSAAGSGVRCFVLGRFAVASVAGNAVQEIQEVADLVTATCIICGHKFPWHRCCHDTDSSQVKRRRLGLPCGHWLFHLAFSFTMQLYDLEERSVRLAVSVCDMRGEFFGVKPEFAARDAAARQQVLSTISELKRGGSDQDHLLAVARVDGSGHAASGAYVVCNSKAEWMDVV